METTKRKVLAPALLRFYDKKGGRFYCAGCDYALALRTWLLANPEQFAIWYDFFEREHKDCHRYKSVAMARAERRFAKILRGGKA